MVLLPDQEVVGDTETVTGFPPVPCAVFRNVADSMFTWNANCGRALIRRTRPRAWVQLGVKADIRLDCPPPHKASAQPDVGGIG